MAVEFEDRAVVHAAQHAVVAPSVGQRVSEGADFVDDIVRSEINGAERVAAVLAIEDGGFFHISDAAAVLRGLNKLWNLSLEKSQLAKIGLEIDSDVPFCIYSEPALVTGKGEIITPIGDLEQMCLVIAKPHDSVSTPSILKKIDYSKIVHQNVDGVLDAISKRDYTEMTKKMGNALEPITAKRHPDIWKIKQKMLNFGCDAAQMSGSGPTVFGVCRKYQRAVRVYNGLRGFCNEVYIVRPFSLKE